MGVLEQQPDEENDRTSYLIQVANATDEQAIVFPLARVTSCGTLSIQVLQAVRSEDDGQKKAIYGSPDPAFLAKKGFSTAFTLLSLLASQPGCFATKDWLSEKLGHLREFENEEEEDQGEGLKRVDNVVSRLRFLLLPPQAHESREEQLLRRRLVMYRRASEESGPGYQLAGLPLLWLDVVHIETHIKRARKLEQFGTDGLAEWQAAYELAMSGRFLAAESYSDWAEWRRRDVEKYLWECVQVLWHRWSEQGEIGEKESIRILRDYWHSHMSNEDALRPLLELLGKSECFGEANSYYNQLCTILAAEGKQPDRRTRDIIDFLQALQLQRKPDDFFLSHALKKYGAGGSEVISTGSDALESFSDPLAENKLVIDRGEAPSTEHFYGRERELASLTAWVQTQRCRLITVCGMGGVGKTSLVARLVDTERNAFEYVFWRSLQQAPSLRNMLRECLMFFTHQQQGHLPEDNDTMIALFIEQLRTSRCLVIFDNYETIMEGGLDAGEYRKGYEDYGRLIQRVGEVQHQSCLLITSREKMRELARLEGKTALTQTLMLQGIGLEEAKVLLQENGLFGSDEVCFHLLNRYSGNPLALKLIAEPIIAFFHADIADFLQEDQSILKDINDIIAQQFNRLSERERNVLFWLAIEREPVAPMTLWEDDSRLSLTSKRDLLDVLLSLRRRSFIEMNEQQLITLQPVVMEYVTDHLVSEVATEIVTGNLHWLSLHALLKAQASEYLRVAQARLILTPLSERLLLSLGREGVEKQCRVLLSLLHHTPTLQKGYAAGNLLNLLLSMQYDLQGYDFSHLALRQAFLQGMHLSDVDFAHAEFSSAQFTDTFGSILSVAFHPDGSRLAAGTTSNYIRFWDMPDGTASLTLQGHTAWVRCVAFSPDGCFLASGSDDQTVRLWDLKQKRCLHVFLGHTAWIRSLVFSPDGHYLVSCSEDRTARLWNIQTGECFACFQGHTSRVRSVALNREGSLLASGSDDQTIRIWDIASTLRH